MTQPATSNHYCRPAEGFIRLVTDAHRCHDFARLDALGNALSARFAPAAICAVARYPHPVVRALAHEALVHLPTPALAGLLAHPRHAPFARLALERQAVEYHNETAHEILWFMDDQEGEFGVTV
jgi:hypothetical protein